MQMHADDTDYLPKYSKILNPFSKTQVLAARNIPIPMHWNRRARSQKYVHTGSVMVLKHDGNCIKILYDNGLVLIKNPIESEDFRFIAAK